MKKLFIAASVGALVNAACGGSECDRTVVGNICTIAGSGESGYFGDDGDALKARMSLPQDTLTADDGTIYILDWNNHRIRKVGSDGIMRHVAGRGELGGTLDDPANADFNHPTGMVFDASKTKLVIAAWHNSKIRQVDLATGVITDTCGDGRRAYFGDEDLASKAALDLPASVAYSPQGDLMVMDQANQVIRRIDSEGKIHRMYGRCIIDRAPPDGPGTCTATQTPSMCPMNSGKATCGNPMAQCGKPCTPGYGGDDGPAAEMRIAQPFGQSADPAGRMAYDKQGTLFFADTTNGLIRKIGSDGIVRRVAGTPPMNGVPQTGYAGDGGPALSAKLYNPVDLAFDDDGTLYFTDVYNHCVRAIGTDGNIRTVAGQCGTPGYTGDGGPASAATLKRAYGIEWVKGTLYIADTGNNVIRAVKLK